MSRGSGVHLMCQTGNERGFWLSGNTMDIAQESRCPNASGPHVVSLRTLRGNSRRGFKCHDIYRLQLTKTRRAYHSLAFKSRIAGSVRARGFPGSFNVVSNPIFYSNLATPVGPIFPIREKFVWHGTLSSSFARVRVGDTPSFVEGFSQGR